MTNVLLYSPEPALPAALAAWIGQDEGLRLAASCDSLPSLLDEAERYPDGVLLVEAGPAVTLPALRSLVANRARLPVILWAGQVPLQFLANAISLGVRGVL